MSDVPSLVIEHAGQRAAERRASPVFIRSLAQYGINKHDNGRQSFEPAILLRERLQRLRHVRPRESGIWLEPAEFQGEPVKIVGRQTCKGRRSAALAGWQILASRVETYPDPHRARIGLAAPSGGVSRR